MKYYTYLFVLVILLITAAKSAPYIVELTPSQKAGKYIYTKGIGSSDVKIMANMSGVNVPATIMTCINCHNARGTGNPEGGIIPSNITWQALTKNYNVKRQDGEMRSPYNEKSLRKVITTGIDPSGNRLHTTMPKYNMTRQDMDNLIAYLKVIGRGDHDTGLSQDRIKIGFALPDVNETLKNTIIKNLVKAYTTEINQSGGIYNRKIEIKFYSEKNLKNEDDVFILTGFNDTYSTRNQTALALLSHSKELLSFNESSKNTFYLYPSIVSQSLSLVSYSNTLLKNKDQTPVVLYYNNDFQKQVAHKIKAKLRSKFNVTPFVSEINEFNIDGIVNNNVIKTNQVLYFIGPYHIGNKLLKALNTKKLYPFIFLAGSISSLDILNAPLAFKNKIFIGYPTWISERKISGRKLFNKLKEKYALGTKWKKNQLDALIMLLTIEESLKRTGQNVNRELFHNELETLYEFSTGLMQPLTYAPNKHIGSTVMYITNFNVKKNKMQLITTINSNEKQYE